MVQSGCDDGAGAKNVKLEIQSNPRPDDGHGGQDNLEASWTTKLTTWAKMKKLSGREVFSNRQTETRGTHRFTMDFPLSVSVLSTDRVLVEGARAFNIHSVDNVDERNRTLVVIAEEGISD